MRIENVAGNASSSQDPPEAPSVEHTGGYRDNAREDQAATDDARIVQATVLWDKGFGRELKMTSLEEYLASLPAIPAKSPIAYLDRLILVERRVTLVAACRLAGLKFSGNEERLVPFDPEKGKPVGAYWMWCQDGRRNRNKPPSQCRKDFQPGEIGCDAFEGVAIYAQDPKVIEDHHMDLPSSVNVVFRDDCAYVGDWGEGPGLSWYCHDGANPYFGSASRGE